MAEPKKKGWIRSQFDFKRWMAVDTTFSRSQQVWRGVKDILRVREVRDRMPLDFEEVARRYGYDEVGLTQTRKNFLTFALIFLLATFLVFGYSIYLMRHHEWFSGFAACSMGLLVFGYAIKFHFWAFMLKKRKLGCSWKEWLSEGFPY